MLARISQANRVQIVALVDEQRLAVGAELGRGHARVGFEEHLRIAGTEWSRPHVEAILASTARRRASRATPTAGSVRRARATGCTTTRTGGGCFPLPGHEPRSNRVPPGGSLFP